MTPDDADVLSDVRRRLPAAREAILRAVGDIPASGGSGGTGGVSDRTGRLACAVIEGVDAAYRDLGRLTSIEWANRTHGGVTRHQLDVLLELCDRWAPTEQRRAAIAANLKAASDDMLDRADWNKCQSHRRIKDVAPPDARRQGGKLCRWCEDWVRALNDPDGDWAMNVDMPPIEMVRANAHGMSINRHLPRRTRQV